ncbi:uncharacterized protein LOC115785209 [Archocentrus centrarchus]|uniref:uncharacterized protein LOC115785209 n=1 Tax=Archocentrus centrarchus TaxID=63155 RepID=UPI0011EA1A15|nr:uncharacterized protein LOC115785209 [Archocentrus centrarchus]
MTTDKTPETKRETEARTMDDLRIVLFGRDDPKCELMKIIENAGQFKKDSKNNPPPEDGTQSLGEYKCQKYSRSINDKNVVIIDAPGVDKRGTNKEKLLEEIKWSVAAADPGPHVFLFVETINKPLSDKLEVLEDFQKTFGEQANDFTMMVFIAASEMNTSDPDSCGSERVKPFRKLTYLFNHRYFIFNIKDDKQQEESQVTKLLEKIAEMRGEASAHFYTPKMVWEAEKALKQEKKMWSNVRDKLLVIGAQVGSTVGLVLSYCIFNGDLSSALGAVGSVVGVVIVAVLYLVFYHLKFKTYTARKEEFSSPDAGAAGKQQLSSASPYADESIPTKASPYV